MLRQLVSLLLGTALIGTLGPILTIFFGYWLLDEPLTGLDERLRQQMRDEFGRLHKRTGATFVLVTHNQDEALSLSDRMAIMHDGKVQQVGGPQELYERPANLFVADFLGKMNFFRGGLDGTAFTTEKGTRIDAQGGVANARHLGVRPERVYLTVQPGQGNTLAGVVESAVYLGSLLEVRVKLDSGETIASQVPNGASRHDLPIATGTRVYASFQPADCVLFSE